MTKSDEIKEQIPAWATDDEVERLRNQFSPPITRDEFARIVRNKNNWKRILKQGEDTFSAGVRRTGNTARIFDCKPLDDQLRLYVVTSADDSAVLSHYFQTE